MPIISNEDSCQIRGIAPAECQALGDADASQVARARTLCDTAFQHDPTTRNKCTSECAVAPMDPSACIAYTAAHQDFVSNQQAQQFHVFGAVAGLLLVSGAYLLGRRARA